MWSSPGRLTGRSMVFEPDIIPSGPKLAPIPRWMWVYTTGPIHDRSASCCVWPVGLWQVPGVALLPHCPLKAVGENHTVRLLRVEDPGLKHALLPAQRGVVGDWNVQAHIRADDLFVGGHETSTPPSGHRSLLHCEARPVCGLAAGSFAVRAHPGRQENPRISIGALCCHSTQGGGNADPPTIP